MDNQTHTSCVHIVAFISRQQCIAVRIREGIYAKGGLHTKHWALQASALKEQWCKQNDSTMIGNCAHSS